MTPALRVRLVLQARTSSVRLPGKVLLPLAGMPLALLCARRLMRDGHDLVVATSDSPDDDQLAGLLEAAGIRCVRGSLHDVLGRFMRAIDDLGDDDCVVRLTADNPLPDAGFVAALIGEWSREQADYLGTHSPFDGLPYGLSAELMRAGALREAGREASAAFDREHVTPWIRRCKRARRLAAGRLLAEDLSHLRCTVDTYDDYARMQALFAAVEPDAVAASWATLADGLAQLPAAPRFRVPYVERDGAAESRLAVGTVQLGMPYGARNRSGEPDAQTAVALLRGAIEHGATWIDTARAYGNAEARVGAALQGHWRDCVKTITKLDPLAVLPADAAAACARQVATASVYRSLHELRADRLDVLMLHRAAHRFAHGGAIWEQLAEMRGQGLIGELGVSVYEVEEAVRALEDPLVRHLQLPFNLLDGRWLEDAFQSALAARPDVRVHVRSVFLQGILLGDISTWPSFDVEGSRRLRKLDELAGELGAENRAALCVSYVLAQPWVTSLVLGMETIAQLAENLELMRSPALSAPAAETVRARLAGAPGRLLNPGMWSQQ